MDGEVIATGEEIALHLEVRDNDVMLQEGAVSATALEVSLFQDNEEKSYSWPNQMQLSYGDVALPPVS